MVDELGDADNCGTVAFGDEIGDTAVDEGELDIVLGLDSAIKF